MSDIADIKADVDAHLCPLQIMGSEARGRHEQGVQRNVHDRAPDFSTVPSWSRGPGALLYHGARDL